jgi:DNA-binding XRE family transcriptional regulator
MKYTVNQAAKIVGITRQTIYRHIDSKPISIEKDDNGNQLIEASELIRVYGDKADFSALNKKAKKTTKEEGGDVTNVTEKVTTIDDKIKIVKLEAEIDKLKELMKKSDEESSYVKDLLEEEKAERKKANNLLEDLRQKENREGEWRDAMKALEERIANQEEETKKRERILVQKNKHLQSALQEEKSKGFFEKLFG